MKPLAIALVLLTASLASCGSDPTRAVILTPDPAKLASCPDAFPVPPSLTPLSSFKLPDGREVVLFDTVIDRERVTAHYIIAGRGAWHDCQSAVSYVRDWTATVAKP